MPQKVEWQWPDFKPEEVLSPSGLAIYHTQDTLLYSPLMLTCLQQLRKQLDRPLYVNRGELKLRGYRSCEENKLAGGKGHSMHLMGIAADVTAEGMYAPELAARAEASGLFSGIGLYRSRNFVHLDIRCKADGLLTYWEG